MKCAVCSDAGELEIGFSGRFGADVRCGSSLGDCYACRPRDWLRTEEQAVDLARAVFVKEMPSAEDVTLVYLGPPGEFRGIPILVPL